MALTHGRTDRSSQPSVEELSEDARAAYRIWRQMDMSHHAAMELVRQDGHRISREAPDPDPTAEFFERRFGFSESTAKSVATRGGDRSAHLHARDVVPPGRNQADGDAGFRAIVEAKRRGGASTDRAALAEAVAHEKRAGRGDHVPTWATDLLEGRTTDELQESAIGSRPIAALSRDQIITYGIEERGLTEAQATEFADRALAERKRGRTKAKGRKRGKAPAESVFVELKESEARSLFGKLGLSPEAATRAAGIKGATS